VVDKPRGPTSHDIVAQTRKLLGTRQVGHTGTLDPMATGVLILLVGEATKLSSVLGADEKVYTARIQFGASTDTDDALGTPLVTAPIGSGLLDRERVEQALTVERDRREQTPPAFSAIKKNGQALYKQARRGVPVVAEPRAVIVKSLECLEIGSNYIDVQLHCAKGYYVRALARDLGSTLGCPAHLSSLRRIRAGQFGIEHALCWPPGSPPAITPLLEVAHRTLHCCELTELGAARARQGKPLGIEHFVPGCMPDLGFERPMAWLFEGRLVALGKWNDSASLRVERGFNT